MLCSLRGSAAWASNAQPPGLADFGIIGGGAVKGEWHDQRACYEKALSIDDANAKAWDYLGDVHGGAVKGVEYDQRSCYEKALSFRRSQGVGMD